MKIKWALTFIWNKGKSFFWYPALLLHCCCFSAIISYWVCCSSLLPSDLATLMCLAHGGLFSLLYEVLVPSLLYQPSPASHFPDGCCTILLVTRMYLDSLSIWQIGYWPTSLSQSRTDRGNPLPKLRVVGYFIRVGIFIKLLMIFCTHICISRSWAVIECEFFFSSSKWVALISVIKHNIERIPRFQEEMLVLSLGD